MPSTQETNDTLPVGVTRRSRRRRKARTDANDDENKENADHEDAPNIMPQQASTKPKKKAAATTKTKKKPPKNTIKAPIVAPIWIYSCNKESKDDLLKRFLKSVDKVATAKAWKEEQQLCQCIIERSMSLTEQRHQQQQSQTEESLGDFLLQYYEDKCPEILTICRKVIKAASDYKTAKKKDAEVTLHGLFVALQGLRALSVSDPPPETSRSEAMIRLLYHVITTAEAAHGDLMAAEQKASKTAKTRRRQKSELLPSLAEEVVFRGYETLCSLFAADFVVALPGKQTMEFTFLRDNNDNLQIPWLSMFPVPNESPISTRKRTTKTKPSKMELSQIFTIGVQTTLAVAKTLLNCSNHDNDVFRDGDDDDDDSERSSLGYTSPLVSAVPSVLARAVDLLRLVGFSWVRFMSFHCPQDDTIAKEIVSFCRQAHRLLWESSSSISQKTGANVGSLETKKHALLILLGHCEAPPNLELASCLNPESKPGRALCTKYFDNVCTMAWKETSGSSSAEEHATIQELNFHHGVGLMLDAVATRLGMQQAFPYIEYSAHRALKIGRRNTRSEHLATLGSCRLKDDNPHSAALFALFLALDLRNSMQRLVRGDKEASTDHPDLIDASQANDIMHLFERVFLGDDQIESPDVRLQCFKISSMASLHSTMYQVSTLSCDRFQANDVATVDTCAQFLTRCYGPFVVSILASGQLQDEKKEAHMWDLVVESYARSAIVWDNLVIQDNLKSSTTFLQRSNSAMSILKDVLVGSDTTTCRSRIGLVEKAAKMFASIGKHRSSRSKDLSLTPMLHSLSLFSESSSLLSRTSAGSENHLVARWSFVAGVFQSLKWPNAASLASAAALAGFASSSVSEYDDEGGDDFWAQVLSTLGCKSHEMIPIDNHGKRLPDKVRALIRRLANNFSGHKRLPPLIDTTSATSYSLSIQDAIGILLDLLAHKDHSSATDDHLRSVFEDRVGERFSLVSLLRALFNARETTLSNSSALIQITGSVLENTGQSMQHNVSSELPLGNDEQGNYEELVEFLVDLVDSIPSMNENGKDKHRRVLYLATLRAAAYVTASCNILSAQEMYEQLLLGTWDADDSDMDPRCRSLVTLASKFATRAREAVILSGNDASDDWTCNPLVFFAVRSATLVFVDTIDCMMADSSPPNNGKSLLACFNDEIFHSIRDQNTQQPTSELACACLERTLSRVRDRLSFQGDKLCAAQVAVWLENVPSTSALSRRWTKARQSDHLISADLVAVAAQRDQEDDPETESNDYSDDHWDHLVQIEHHLAGLRLELLESDERINLDLAHGQVHLLLDRVQSVQDKADDENNESLASWVKSSALTLLSEIAARSGNLGSALSHMKLCCQSYQETTTVASLAFAAAASGHHQTVKPPFAPAILETLMIGSREKVIQCLQQMSLLYATNGDYRKSEVYSLCALNSSGGHGMFERLKPNVPLPELLHLFRDQPPASLKEMVCRRTFLWSRATATTYGLVISQLEDPLAVVKSLVSVAQTSRFNIDASKGLFLVGDILYDMQTPTARAAALVAYEKASTLYGEAIGDGMLENLAETTQMTLPLSSGKFLFSVWCQMQLGRIRSILESDTELESSSQQDVTSSCLELANAPLAPKECRAWALYYLGLISLQTARKANALAALWAGFSNEESTEQTFTSKDLAKARQHFSAALTLLGPASFVLTRMVLRALALVTGPERDGKITESSSCILINTSIGCTARQAICQLAQGSVAATDDDSVSTASLLGALDIGFAQTKKRDAHVRVFLTTLRDWAPPEWRFVASALCPTGELLITAMKVDDTVGNLWATTVCLFPGGKTTNSHVLYNNHTYENAIKPMDALILESQQQLKWSGSTESGSSSDPESVDSDASAKREWWKERTTLDESLQQLLFRVEGEHFGSPCAREALFGSESIDGSLDDSLNSSGSIESCVCNDLSSRFEAVSLKSSDDDDDVLPSVGIKKRAETSSRRGKPARRHLDIRRDSLANEGDRKADQCTFLILDENLHRFPFEGLPSFANKSVCRFPSLPFALASLKDHARPSQPVPVVDPQEATYVLNPEANLSATQERLLPFFEKMNKEYGWDWGGVSGELPSSQFMGQNLAKEGGLFLYCGHGGGQCCYSRSKVEGLIKQKWSSKKSAPSCESSVLLMGCSSGRLESVNRKGTEPLANHAIFYEPEGIALSYLLAGAPCVVGNLWDVTDRDIDRYCQSMLQSLADAKSNNIAHAVAQARSSCKMQFMVGCAPVCYGLPTQLRQAESR
ncbi:extra spindle pole bodies homolog 1 (Saccharomyces cerevisiae) [Seminavis robusta]|uniref:separase n=1 Tax=Seminavis robusta TaxID=568900 RepID=A0A9N8HAC1_9STRA|nr:extra spindle pole bodies homolog 1 (Saccharomyces cerevisiae) [Seminavis robusta]|eukprot:Sro289_g109220.1 extra spindle pole bodies homolog 1 (Saccharomyces cerevisiae) (2258) ;mRNA; f:69688-76635